MAKCRGVFTAVKFCLFSIVLVLSGLLAGNMLSGGEESFFAAFLQTEARPASAEEKRITIVIDAGHGGMDGGAVSDAGVAEKDINLAVAMRLRELFLLADADVVMTRTEDVMLCSEDSKHRKREDLESRVRIAESHENAVFLSIHMNKFPVEKYSGLQVYYSRSNDASRDIAESIQKKTADFLQSENKRRVKPADSSIYVLDKLDIPAVLVECGFLSNRAEAALLSDAAYQDKLACIIYAAVADVLSR